MTLIWINILLFSAGFTVGVTTMYLVWLVINWKFDRNEPHIDS